MASNSTYQRASGALQGAGTGATIGSAIAPGVGTVIGGLIGGLGGAIFGKSKKRPNMIAPEFIDVETVDVPESNINLGDVSRENIDANFANLPRAEQLARMSDKYAQDNLLSLTEQALPGFREYQKKLTQAGMERLENQYELPQDQVEFLRRQAAERGVSRGTAGQFNEFDLMRDFGISSMQYGSQRLQEAQSVFQQLNATMPRVNPTSPLNFLTTSAQAQQQAQFDANYEFNATQFDFNQKLAQRNARQAQKDMEANIANMNATGQYAQAERRQSDFWANLSGATQTIAPLIKDGFSGTNTSTNTPFSQSTIASEMQKGGQAGLSKEALGDMERNLMAWGK